MACPSTVPNPAITTTSMPPATSASVHGRGVGVTVEGGAEATEPGPVDQQGRDRGRIGHARRPDRAGRRPPAGPGARRRRWPRGWCPFPRPAPRCRRRAEAVLGMRRGSRPHATSATCGRSEPRHRYHPPIRLSARARPSRARPSSRAQDQSDVARPACLRYRAHVARSPLPRECPSCLMYRHRPGVSEAKVSGVGPAPGRGRSGDRPLERAEKSLVEGDRGTDSLASQNPHRGESSGLRLGHDHHPHARRLGRDGTVEGVLDGQAAGRVDAELRRRSKDSCPDGACPAAPTRPSATRPRRTRSRAAAGRPR